VSAPQHDAEIFSTVVAFSFDASFASSCASSCPFARAFAAAPRA